MTDMHGKPLALGNVVTIVGRVVGVIDDETTTLLHVRAVNSFCDNPSDPITIGPGYVTVVEDDPIPRIGVIVDLSPAAAKEG